MDVRNRLLALWWADHIVKKRHKKRDEFFDTYPTQQGPASNGWKPGNGYWGVMDCSTQKTGEPCHAGQNCKCSAGQSTRTKGSMSMMDDNDIEKLRDERKLTEERAARLAMEIRVESKCDGAAWQTSYKLLIKQQSMLHEYIDVLSERILDLLENP